VLPVLLPQVVLQEGKNKKANQIKVPIANETSAKNKGLCSTPEGSENISKLTNIIADFQSGNNRVPLN